MSSQQGRNILSWLYSRSAMADDFSYSDLPMPEAQSMPPQRFKPNTRPASRRLSLLTRRLLPTQQTNNVVANLESQQESMLNKENKQQEQELDYMFKLFLSALKKSSLNDISLIVQEMYSTQQLPTKLHMEAEELLENVLGEGRRLQWEKAEKEAKNPELIRKTRNLLMKSLKLKKKRHASSRTVSKHTENLVASLQETNPFFTQDDQIAQEVDYFFDSFMTALKKSSSQDLSQLVQQVYSSPSIPVAFNLESEFIIENLLSEGRRLQWEKAEKEAKHPELIRKTRQLLETSLQVKTKNKQDKIKAKSTVKRTTLPAWTVLVKELWEVATDSHPMLGDHLAESIVQEALNMRKSPSIKAKL